MRQTKSDRARAIDIDRGCASGRLFSLADRHDRDEFKRARFLADPDLTPSAWPEPGDEGVVLIETRTYKMGRGRPKETRTIYHFYERYEGTTAIYSTFGWTFSDPTWIELID